MHNFLESTFPELRGKIEGANYPAPPILLLFGNLLSVLQVVALVWMVFGGEIIFQMLGYNRQHLPPWYFSLQQNGFQFCCVLFFVLPQLVTTMSTSGAFEIYVNDKLVWSKLQTKTFPSTEDIIRIFQAQGLGMGE
jgi:selT/selW/selH-like putative selenoprotein